MKSQEKSLILQEVPATCLLTNMQVLQHLSDRCSPLSAYNIKHLLDSLVMRSNKLCARVPWADWAPNQTDMKDTTRPAVHKGFTIVMIEQVVGEGAASIVRIVRACSYSPHLRQEIAKPKSQLILPRRTQLGRKS